MLNCKVKCVDDKGEFHTKGRIYNVRNGKVIDDSGEYSVKIFNDIEEINYDFESQFELVEPTTPPDKTGAAEEMGNTYWDNICAINARQESKGKAKYGETLEDNTTLSTVQRIEHLQEELLDGLKYCEHLKKSVTDAMMANDYQRMAMRTGGEYKSEYDMLRNAAYGLNGEAGEVIDLLKKHEFQGHKLDKEKLIDELGDVQWYIALAAKALDVTLEEIMQHNIDKLIKRYPEGFDKSRSINREENNAIT